MELKAGEFESRALTRLRSPKVGADRRDARSLRRECGVGKECTRSRENTKGKKMGKPEFCPRMGNRKGISRRGAGARREKIQKIVCLGFYSRGFASFAGQGGFAADLGRFGETTLPFFRWALTEQRPPVFFSAPLRLRVRFFPRSARKSAAAR